MRLLSYVTERVMVDWITVEVEEEKPQKRRRRISEHYHFMSRVPHFALTGPLFPEFMHSLRTSFLLLLAATILCKSNSLVE